MLNLKKLQASTALALTLGVSATSIAPMTLMGAANATQTPQKVAQLFPSQRPASTFGVRIPAGASFQSFTTKLKELSLLLMRPCP
ncbi:MAG: hypothetical protein HC936_19240 [Leptolyngbyaceae cyanobacterium SU_3_3]|nr:hypothetical protein [Leptolyngbyaceae cyanobacterium SU_3_3]